MRADAAASLEPRRRALVLTLLALPVDVAPVLEELAELSWDSEGAVELDSSALCVALESAVSGSRSFEELLLWAEAIEVREDVTMPDPRVREVIHALANPDLEGGTDETRVQGWLAVFRGLSE